MADYNNLIIAGSVFTAERWSTHCSYKGYNTAAPDRIVEDYADLQAWAEHVRDTFNTASSTGNEIGNFLSSAVTVDTIRVEWRNESGLQQAAEVTGPDLTETAPPEFPPQIATVVSLRTGRPGRSYRGRMYWPTLSLAMDTATGLMDDDDRGRFSNLIAEKLVEWGQFDSGADMDPAIYSPTLDEVTEVTSVQVGQVYDTQRRRRDDLLENYSVRDL